MDLNHKNLTPNLNASQGLRFMANSDLWGKYKLYLVAVVKFYRAPLFSATNVLLLF